MVVADVYAFGEQAVKLFVIGEGVGALNPYDVADGLLFAKFWNSGVDAIDGSG